MSTIFWPRDVLYDGYFYGWIIHHTACVAGILNTDTRADADVTLANTVRSNDLRGLLTSCGTPTVLGYVTFSSFRSSTILNIKDQDASLISPVRLICYHRHAKSSMRFYAPEVCAPSLTPFRNEVKTPMEVSLAHDFTRRRDMKVGVPEYQPVVDLVS
ncbi:hypothetical protein J3R83DRAFT_1796, partial [Lanmaoa asiatica]